MPIKVMSFNLRTATAPDGDQAWCHRKALAMERIRAFAPDLLGLQECREDEQAAFVRTALPEYEFIGVPRHGEGDSAVEMAPLLYRRAAFEELGRGHFWLSATPEQPGSQSWGAAYPRTATWVKLHPREWRGGSLVFLTTHFDFAGTSREESASLLQRWVTAAVGDGPLIVTGDFNAERASATHQILTDGLGLQDPLQDYGVMAGSYHDFGRARPFEAIDWILVSRHFQVLEAAVDTFRAGPLYPSDHFPVTTCLQPVAGPGCAPPRNHS